MNIDTLAADEFLERFLVPRRPALVRGAAMTWNWAPEWSLDALVDRFGHHRVPLYGSLFTVHGVSTFGNYVARHTGAVESASPPYLRWYARQSPDRMLWADAAFAELADDWAMPDWLPRSDYLLPRLPGTVDAARNPFPAKGLFVCGKGGRTRLHVDPWTSDACLCQATGTKRVLLFAPETADLLGGNGGLVDLDDPDDAAFPRWREAKPEFDVVLHPGDCLYIPAGWPHAATALTDSVSVTWNFVHRVHETSFERYLRSGGAADPAVRYFTQPGLM